MFIIDKPNKKNVNLHREIVQVEGEGKGVKLKSIRRGQQPIDVRKESILIFLITKIITNGGEKDWMEEHNKATLRKNY